MPKTSKNRPKLTTNQRTISVPDLRLSNPQNIQPVYANNASVGYTPHDLRITFSEIVVGLAPTEEPTLQLRASVSMSPTQFKALLDAMNRTLEIFNDQMGKVTWPPVPNAKSEKTQ